MSIFFLGGGLENVIGTSGVVYSKGQTKYYRSLSRGKIMVVTGRIHENVITRIIRDENDLSPYVTFTEN